MDQKGLKPIAIFEASKGLIALLIGLGIHELAGENIQQSFERILTHLHLNPASHYPSIFINTMSELSHSNLVLVALGALLYSIVRFVEAYGLWHGFKWTEWLALISGAVYLPFELYKFIVNFNVLSFSLLLINSDIVVYIYRVLKSKHHKG
jgi:uncharacterized membrane protein (DUF2068 family)